jgi:hypothetical protein
MDGHASGAGLTGAAEQFRENSAARREIILITDLQEGAKLDGLQGYQWPAGTRVTRRAACRPKAIQRRPGNSRTARRGGRGGG